MRGGVRADMGRPVGGRRHAPARVGLLPMGVGPAPGPRQLPSCAGSSRLSSGSKYPGKTTGTSASATGAPRAGPIAMASASAGGPSARPLRPSRPSRSGPPASRPRRGRAQDGQAERSAAAGHPAHGERAAHRGQGQEPPSRQADPATEPPPGPGAGVGGPVRPRPGGPCAASSGRQHPHAAARLVDPRDLDQDGHRVGRATVRPAGRRHRFGVELHHGGHPAFLAFPVASSIRGLRSSGRRRGPVSPHHTWRPSPGRSVSSSGRPVKLEQP